MRLVFVYNANAGRANAILDGIHKILSPSTYDCKLCAITFGIFSENKKWKQFKESSDIDMVFYHKDEFGEKYKALMTSIFDFPIIFLEENDTLNVLISTKELHDIENIDVLITEIKNRLAPN